MILTTYYSENFSALADLTVPRMARWAKQNGWDFVIPAHVHADNIYWAKTKHLVDLLASCSTGSVLWLDVDCLVIDPTRGFPGEKICPWKINVGTDQNGICCALLLLPCLDKVRACLQQWLFCGQMRQEPGKSLKYDQSTLKHLMATFPSWEAAVNPMPGLMSDPTQELDDPFVYHAWSTACGLDIAIERMKARLQE